MEDVKMNEEDEREIKDLLRRIINKLDEISKNVRSYRREIKLTKYQNDILDAVQNFFLDKKVAPTAKDIADLKSLPEPTVSGYLNTLAEEGFLDRIVEHKDLDGGRRVRVYRYMPKIIKMDVHEIKIDDTLKGTEIDPEFIGLAESKK